MSIMPPKTLTERVEEAKPKAAVIDAFIAWLYENEYRICREYEFGFAPAPDNTEELIAKALGIDLPAAYEELKAREG